MEITDLERRIFGVLRTKDWLNVEDVAVRAKVPIGTAKMFCEMFWREGFLVQRDTYPTFRYRANSMPMNTKYRERFAALMAATEPVSKGA